MLFVLQLFLGHFRVFHRYVVCLHIFDFRMFSQPLDLVKVNYFLANILNIIHYFLILKMEKSTQHDHVLLGKAK